jgi:FKBP-type peptidyl-prolyl cis-trans isomerase FkpA
MRLNLTLFVLLNVGVGLSACAATPGSAGQTASAPETEDQKVLYALGQALGQNIKDAGLSEQELASVILGLNDSALGRASKVDMNEYGPKLQAFMNGKMAANAAAELGESQAFMEQQAKLPGATKTTSGIVIQEMKPGTGAMPKADDVVP